MKTYRIQINAIDTIYEANSEEQALENYAIDSGYENYDELVKEYGEVQSISEVVDFSEVVD